MKVVIFRDEKNLNLIKNSQWEYFSNKICKIFEYILNEKIAYSNVSLDSNGKNVDIIFHIKEYESLKTLKFKFEDFLCKEAVYNDNGKQKVYQFKKIELLWHKFLVECLGDKVLDDLFDFYKKTNRDFNELKDFVRHTEGF